MDTADDTDASSIVGVFWSQPVYKLQHSTDNGTALLQLQVLFDVHTMHV